MSERYLESRIICARSDRRNLMATARERGRNPKSREKLELTPEQARILDLVATRLGGRSRSDLLQDALGMLLWHVQETQRGRKVVSVVPKEAEQLEHAVELARPVATLSSPDLYEYLVARPHRWRRQLGLKGRNMSVGQLVASMNVENMTAQEGAERYELPLAQVQEALVYYEANKDLIEAEFREEKRILQAHGFARDVAPLPG
jgi:uncharacterized protein (DUF433 family)